MTKEEKLYLEAKKAYYSGNSIMTDDEFDSLENILKNKKSEVINIVGSNETSSKTKIAHISPMLSLAKIKASKNTLPPTDEFKKWLNKTSNGNLEFIIEPKFDGNACNVIYRNGKFDKAVTRGDGKEGYDISHVIKHLVPETININEVTEIRGEVLIKKDIFNEKYSEFKNARNYIAGLLHRDDVTFESIQDTVFMPFEVKVFQDNSCFYVNHEFFFDNNFKNIPYCIYKDLSNNTSEQFKQIFEKMLYYRDVVSEYLLDGFVCKYYNNEDRIRLGETDHHPDWGLAVKFESRSSTTELLDIEWNLSRSGNLIPVAILSPLDLDGCIITRCSLYNYKFVRENKILPGCILEIAKMGDIIPAVISIVEESKEYYL